jgi:hypothetical protein
LLSSTSQAAVSQVLAAGGTSAGSIRATATDALGQTGTADINVSLSNTFLPSPPVPPVTPPLVGPSLAWTGTAGSGGVAPVDPPRTTAKPALQSFTPSYRRLTANTVIGFDAFAFGGVASVTIWVEGTSQTVLRSIYTEPDVNGVSQSYDGYWITLDAEGAAARHSTGAAMNIYGEATATDATMQTRVVGPIVVYPRATAIAWQKTVKRAGGGDYTNLTDAWNALRAATPESAMITVGASGETADYELGTPSVPGAWTGHTGYVVLAAAAGANVSLVRGAAFDPLNTTTNGVTAWQWWPWTGPIEFRGSGITLDMKNWYQVKCGTEVPHWFNGCQIINSIGVRDTVYWNGAPPPAFEVSSFSNVLRAWFTNGVSRYVDLASTPAAMVNWDALDQLTGGHGECRFIAGCYETGSDPRVFTTQLNALSVTYNSTGVASIVADVGAGGTLDCKVDGVSVGGGFPISLGNSPAATYFTMAQVAAKISAIPGGHWSATVLDSTRACWQLAQRTLTPTPRSPGRPR